MKTISQKSRACRSRGTAAVELAILLPLLLLLVFGCVDYGRALYSAIALENAVGSGCEYAATHRFTDYTKEAWSDRIRQRVTEEMQNVPCYDSEKLSVGIETASEVENGVLVTVTGTYEFTPVVDWPGFPTGIVLRHRLCAWQYR